MFLKKTACAKLLARVNNIDTGGFVSKTMTQTISWY